MDHAEMVALIRDGVRETGGVWADFGAGTGNFTWALAELLGPQAQIYAFDRDKTATTAQLARLQSQPPLATIIPRQADVTRLLDMPALDGILMANLLHFIRDQRSFLQRICSYLQPHGQLLIVEYEQSLPIPWVPFPVPFARLTELAHTTHMPAPRRIAIRRSPSSGRTMYAAVLTQRS